MSRKLVWGAAMLVAALGTNLLVAVDSADAQLFSRLRAQRCCYVQTTCRPINYCAQTNCTPYQSVACAQPASFQRGCVVTQTASIGCQPCATPCATASTECQPCVTPTNTACCRCVTRCRPILRTCSVRCRPVRFGCVRACCAAADFGGGVETTVIEESAPVEAPGDININPEA